MSDGGAAPGNTTNAQRAFNDLARSARERGDLYSYLSRVFRREITAAQLQELRAPAFLSALFKAGVQLDDAFLSAPSSQLIQDLAVEYTRLFLGPGPHIPPYASVHLHPGGGALMGQPAVDIKHYLEQAGFQYQAEYSDLPDHISVELEFMAHVSWQEGRAWELKDIDGARNALEYAREFLNCYLSPWISVFCEAVVARSSLAFYKEMAQLTDAFIAADLLEILDRLEIASTQCQLDQ